jgi:hypothetical protein
MVDVSQPRRGSIPKEFNQDAYPMAHATRPCLLTETATKTKKSTESIVSLLHIPIIAIMTENQRVMVDVSRPRRGSFP